MLLNSGTQRRTGQLRLELPKETYEKAGLVGEPIRDAGRKHVKTRYAITLDLRKPSMVHGKKGFERIVWAFKNVLNNAVTWLFYDCDTAQDAPADIKNLSEWLSLVSLQSPRVHADDEIDPYLSRYSKPDGDLTEIKKLVVLKWSGFIPAEWLRQLFILCL
ncbi:MAG: hypothetical protein Q9208_001028 [Pyrenodesmia sp. 3 TL-2023]